jgi:Zn-dependent protease/CBS domain-containing protein
MSGFKIGTIRGIPLRIHFTFLLILPLLAIAFARAFRVAAAAAEVPPEQLAGSPWLWGLGVALALFASVLVHELAHSLYALRKGGRIRDITLLMIGGVSRVAEPPKSVRHEAVMALVGPLVSLALGALLFALHAVAPSTSFNFRFALFYVGSLNLFLGLFNLLPAFPMDGGRILRAVLVPRLGLIRATNVAAAVGKVFAVGFGLWGLFTFNLLLLLVAFFVFTSADAETRAVTVQALLGHLRVRDLMSAQGASLPGDVSVHEAAERMLRERRLAFAVTVDGAPTGLITLDAIQAIAPEKRAELPLREIAVEAPSVAADEEVGKALRLMGELEVPQLAVVEDGRLVGTLSRDDIVRGLKLGQLEATQQAPGDWPRRRHRWAFR